uniref:5PtaseI n=1 Tax=Pararge aegeria TaxID=116150 RepID=S4PRZ7_9NEOP
MAAKIRSRARSLQTESLRVPSEVSSQLPIRRRCAFTHALYEDQMSCLVRQSFPVSIRPLVNTARRCKNWRE